MSDDCCKIPARQALPDGHATTWARRFKALSDPTRVQIVSMLAGASGTLCVCEIEAAFDLSQPTISHHLKLLRDAGIVTAERRGSNMHHAIDADALHDLVSFGRALGCC